MSDDILVYDHSGNNRHLVKARPVRVIKRRDREKSAADYQRDHEIALLKLLAKKHPDIAADLATTTAK